MPQPAVNDMDLLDSLLQRVEAALNFWNHTSGDGAIGDHASGLGRGERVHEAIRITDVLQHAWNVAQNNHFFSSNRGGYRGRGGIGIHVELRTVAAEGH